MNSKCRHLLDGNLVCDLVPVFFVLAGVFAPVDGAELEEAQALGFGAAGAGASARARSRLDVLGIWVRLRG